MSQVVTTKGRKSEVAIRNIEIDDIASVYHLGEMLFTSDELPILYRTWDPYEVTYHFTSDPDYCLVAEIDGRIVGFVLATTIVKAGTAWKKYGYLSWMGVDENYQRTKLGQRLYHKLEERLHEDGVRMVIADTAGDNIGAIAFFKATGFSVRSEHLWLAKTLSRRTKKTDWPRTAAVNRELKEPHSHSKKIGAMPFLVSKRVTTGIARKTQD